MENNVGSVLFLTPFFGYSGSEVALYNIVHHWPDTSQKLSVAHFGKGELATITNTSVTIFNFKDYYNKKNTLVSRIARFIFRHKEIPNYSHSFLKEITEKTKPDVIVLNTLIMTEHLCYLEKLQIPLVLYVHEMDWTFSHFTRSQLVGMSTIPHLVICCSKASKKGFAALAGTSNIKLAYPGVAFDKIKITKTKAEVYDELGIPMNSTLIAMSGSIDRNKDPQVFVRTASALIRQHPSCYFIWIGGNKNSGDAYYAELTAKTLGIDGKLIFTGQLSHEVYYNYLHSIDYFFLTSVFDSFPLVMLEAAYLKKPIISFNSGGISEFIEPNTGLILQSRNSEKAAAEIYEYIRHTQELFDQDKAKANALQYSAQQSAIHFQQAICSSLCV